jgi:adenine specific DNA methylase Mod
VLDAFMGSGTTIIAAQKIGRLGYGLELDPSYVDVAVRRWQRLTGEIAVHAETGLSFAEMEETRSQVDTSGKPASNSGRKAKEVPNVH